MPESTTHSLSLSAADLVLSLNESLSKLLARIQELQREVLPAGVARDLGRIEVQALGCREALRNAVAEERETAPRSMVLRAEEILIRALERAETHARTVGVRVSLALSPDLPRVLGDPVALEHAFLLVVADALHCVETGGAAIHVAVDATRREGCPVVRIVISDERPTPPFAPLPDLWAEGKAGGLAVSRDVIVDHGGSFSLHAQAGGGVVVEINLPAMTSTWARD